VADLDHDRWPGLLAMIGLAAGIALGAVLVLLFRDRRGSLGGALGAAPAPVNIWNMPGMTQWSQMPQMSGMPGLPASQLTATSQPISMDTRMKTVQLAPDAANRLFVAAGQNPWIVDVSVAGPPGSFAFVSTDLSQLNPGFVGHGNTASIAAGQDRRIRLQPGQDLYGVSNVAGVMVSIIASEESLPPSLTSYLS
jgi:hypothetical protein